MKLLVTTGHKSAPEQVQKALEFSKELGVPYIQRKNQNIEDLLSIGADHILAVTRKGLVLFGPDGEHFFHPSMAKVRIKSLINGNPDQMINAMALTPGDRVLDCTLGLASDALVAAHHLGAGGEIVGLEKVPVLALIVEEGLKSYPEKDLILKEAMTRIKVINEGYREFLTSCPDKTFDVIYFDPMFRAPQEKTSAFVTLRQIAHPEPLDAIAVQEALRVAQKRVILKERRQSMEFTRLGFDRVIGGKYSPVAYGVIDVAGRSD